MDGRSSMGRGLDVLAALADSSGRPPYRSTVKGLAEQLGRHRSQVSRTLQYLVDRGVAVRDDDGYRLSWQWYAQAQELVARRLRADGLTVLEQLSERTGEAAFLGVLEGDSTVTIAESVPPSTGLIGSWVGRGFPAYCSDAGQAVLWDAADDEVRAVFEWTEFAPGGPNGPTTVEEFLRRLTAARTRGYSIVDQEAEPELFSVAAPVRDFRDEVVAAVQLVGPRSRLAPRVEALGAECVAASAVLSSILGAPNAPRPGAERSGAERSGAAESCAGVQQ